MPRLLRWFIAALLALVAGTAWTVTVWYLAMVFPHTLPTNEYYPYGRVLIGFVRAPRDMDPYRGMVRFQVVHESSGTPQVVFLVPPRYTEGRIKVSLEYWTRGCSYKKRYEQYYMVTREPGGAYNDISRLHEVALYDRNDRGELIVLGIAQLRRPGLIPSLLPPVAPEKPLRRERPYYGPRIS